MYTTYVEVIASQSWHVFLRHNVAVSYAAVTKCNRETLVDLKHVLERARTDPVKCKNTTGVGEI